MRRGSTNSAALLRPSRSVSVPFGFDYTEFEIHNKRLGIHDTELTLPSVELMNLGEPTSTDAVQCCDGRSVVSGLITSTEYFMTTNFLLPLTGSFAQPAAENPTMVMIEAAFRYHGLPWRYINCEVAPSDLGDAVRGARAMGWRGFNCSIPHKVAVIEHLDRLGESARIIGAVNTIVVQDGQLIGENTDGKGFVQALSQIIDPAGHSIMLFGAGGAGRAVGVELALAGAQRITVVNRSRAKGEELAALIAEHTPAESVYCAWDGPVAVPNGTGIVVHATSQGLYPNIDQMPDIDIDSLSPDMVVADGIHNPPETRLLQAARAQGCRTVDGLAMLVGQGVIGLKYWAGIDANPDVMRRALLDLDL